MRYDADSHWPEPQRQPDSGEAVVRTNVSAAFIRFITRPTAKATLTATGMESS